MENSVYSILIIIFVVYIIDKMSIIKDFNNLPIYVKGIVITILFVLPFWSVILAYYFKGFIQLDIFKIMFFSFIPSLIWASLFIIGARLTENEMRFLDQHDEIKEPLNNKVFWIATATDVLIYLIVLGIVLICLNVNFTTFMISIFSYKVATLFFIKPFLLILRRMGLI